MPILSFQRIITTRDSDGQHDPVMIEGECGKRW